MTVLNAYIQTTAEFVEAARSRGTQVKSFAAPASAVELREGLPFRVGPGASQRVLLREDTYVELGNPESGSCACILVTDRPSIVKDGRITVIGPDIAESAGLSLPFAQILIVGGTALQDEDIEPLRATHIVGDQIEGYMVRSYSHSIWSRVSKDIVARGFNLESLGRALMAIYKSGNGKIQSMEILFVTSGKDDVRRLDDIAAQVRKIAREIVKQTWKIRGYDIDCLSNCSTCDDKPVCDEIREMLKVKKSADDIGGA